MRTRDNGEIGGMIWSFWGLDSLSDMEATADKRVPNEDNVADAKTVNQKVVK